MKQLLFSLLLFANQCLSMQNEHWSSITYEAATHQYNAATKLIDQHLPDFSGCYEILNVGCGQGNISFYLTQKTTAHIHGIDKSFDRIQTAKKKNTLGTRVTFDTFDANDHLPFIDQFDIVFSFATLHWIKHQECLFQKLVKGTAKNGTLLINATIMDSDHPLLKALHDLQQNEPWKSVFAKTDLKMQFFPLQQPVVEQWCKDNNLKVEAMYVQPDDFTFFNRQELATWLNSWLAESCAIAKLSEETRNTFITGLTEKYASYINHQDGVLTHSWPQLILKATKPYRTSGPDQNNNKDSNHHIIS